MAAMMQEWFNMIAAQPHLETVASGNTGYCDAIARFKTNLTLPLKEANITLSPIQGGSGDPSPTNVRAISGVDSIQVTKAGVNLLECDTFSNGTDQGITYTKTVNDSNQIESIQATGTTSSGNVFRNLNYTQTTFKLLEGTFDFYGYSTQVAVIPVHTNTHYNDISGKWASNFTTVDWDKYNITKQASAWARLQVVPYASNIEVNTTVYPMMCLPQDEGCDYEPFKGIKYNISFPSTIYNGALDLLTGALTATHACITFDGSSDEQWNVETISAGTNFYIQVADADYEDAIGGTQICNMAVKRGTNEYAQGRFFISSSKNFNLAIGDLINVTTPSAFREWLTTHNVQLYYKLATPLVYQLTPQVIRTFRGVNNIWSDNGIMNIKYWTN